MWQEPQFNQRQEGWSLWERKEEGTSIAMAIGLGTSYFLPPLFCVKFLQRAKEDMWHDITQLVAASCFKWCLIDSTYSGLHQLPAQIVVAMAMECIASALMQYLLVYMCEYKFQLPGSRV